MQRNIFTKILLSLVIFDLSSGGGAVFGQTRRGSQKGIVPVKSEKKPVCQGGWSGVVTYSKILKDSLESDEPGIRKEKDRIKHKTSRDYDYNGRLTIDGTDPKTPVVSAKVSYTDTSLNWGEERVFDTCNSRENGHWFIIEGTDNRRTSAQVQGPARSFNLSVDEFSGAYSFNFALPDAVGEYNREQHTKRSGHCQVKNNEPFDKTDKQTIKEPGATFSITGQQIDPNDPNHLSGSKIWGGDTGQVKGFIYQVTWRFTRCPEKLLITEYKFEHPKFPDFGNWQEIPRSGTIDGNRIKIKAKVLNMSAETKYADLSFDQIESNKVGATWHVALPNAESSLRLEAGEEREVEYIWDSEGQSWYDDGRPHYEHPLRAVLKEAGNVQDEKTEKLKIAPKPVVLVHGLWSTNQKWAGWPYYLVTAHSAGWRPYIVGEDPSHGRMLTGKKLTNEPSLPISKNAVELAKYIRFAQEDANAWHVDLVAHSIGGLVSRFYINSLMPASPDNRPVVKHLVMIATPNAGSNCAAILDVAYDFFGDRLTSLRQMRPDAVEQFNMDVTDQKGVRFSALAGNPLPVMCGEAAWNDGAVTVRSATHGVPVNGTSKDLGKDLTNLRNFTGFVKPQLVTGPNGRYPIPYNNDPTGLDRFNLLGENVTDGLYDNVFRNASYGAAATNSFSKSVKLEAEGTMDIDISAVGAANLGVTFVAESSVSAFLIDPTGVIRSKNEAGSEIADSDIRSLFCNKPVAAGTWKIRLKNTSKDEQIFMAVGWSLERPAAPQVAE